MIPDTKTWEIVGETANTRFFRIEDGILAALPHAGSTDDLVTARENAAFQSEFFRSLGRPGVLLVFFDPMVSQDKDARRVYQTMDPRVLRAAALVAETLLGRAIASWFLGVSKPPFHVKNFGSVEGAIAWAREMNAAVDAEPMQNRAEERL